MKLNKINEVKNYFIDEIKERELMSKRLSKYLASFDHFDKYLIALSYQQQVVAFLLHQDFIKKQEAKGLLSNLGIRTPLSKVPIL